MNLVFSKKNYQWMLIGLAVLFFGFVLMALDGEPYGFGLLGLTIGPLFVLIGFGIQFYAIMLKSNTTKSASRKG